MRTALSNFDSSLSRIRAVASDMDARILSSSPAERLRDETLRCAATVILSGFFESFLKDCTQAYVTLVCSRRVPFVNLSPLMQKQHFVVGGQILGFKYKKEGKVSWISADHLDIAKRLSSPTGQNGDYTLIWEAFASTEGNPSPTVILKILESLGVNEREPRLNRATANGYSALKLALQSFIDVRNECAHTGTTLNVPTTAELVGYCDLLYKIASAFVSVLEQKLSEAPLGVDLNTADATELSRIPGFGRNRVAALIQYRAANGKLAGIDEISCIPGIGKKLVEVIKLHAHVS